MSKIKPTLNSADIELLEKNFATKDDLKNLVTRDDAKNFATKDDLKTLATKKGIKRIENKFDYMFKFFDKHHIVKLEKRVKTIENHLRIPTPEF